MLPIDHLYNELFQYQADFFIIHSIYEGLIQMTWHAAKVAWNLWLLVSYFYFVFFRMSY